MNQETFKTLFNADPEVNINAPGRVNLIGEHTDYNDGFVLPVAIQFSTNVIGRKRNDNIIRVASGNYNNALVEFSLNDIQTDAIDTWSNYVRGVVKHLALAFPSIGGADLFIKGNVPEGAGLSSSAALEIGLLKCFSELYKLPIDGTRAAQLGQEAENKFVGCACGIMDQLISACGTKHHALLLDCENLEQKQVSIPDGLALAVINSNVKRGLVDSEYNLRREQCESAAKVMGKASLRHTDIELLNSHKNTLTELEYRRAKHVITENERVHQSVKALQIGDIKTLSKLFSDSHESMKLDFEITTPAIDGLVDIIRTILGEQGGVRMTGGGFGGCVIALAPESLMADVERAVADQYQAQSGLKEDFYICSIENGAFA